MPTIKVPLKDAEGWDTLMKQRKTFWAKDENSKLSTHFRAQEFYCHDGTPCPTTARPAMVKLCQVFLEPMRTKFGACFVLSGYRHVLYNARVGGAKQSQHIYEYSYECVAADLRFQKGTPAQWAAYARIIRSNKNKGRGGVGRYDRAGFCHVDNRLYKADWSG
jgi:hypothetical protein